MSYFLGMPIQQYDMGDKRVRRKGKSKIQSVDNELEPVHGAQSSPQRRVSKAKHVTYQIDDIVDNIGDDEKTKSPKCKSRRHLRKEIERLSEENHALSAKLEQTKSNEESSIKDEVISKIHYKYNRLARDYERIQQDYQSVVIRLQQGDSAYKKLLAHNEELKNVILDLERKKSHLAGTNQDLKSENIQLNEDVLLLKNVVYRLNIVLEKYQEKLKQNGHTTITKNVSTIIDETCDENDKIVQSWGNIDTHTLAPLLNAYQENLMEKEELIVKSAQELDEFGSKCKEIIAENEHLHVEVENYKLKCKASVEEIKSITDDAILIKEQNDLLVKQVNAQKQKLQEMLSLYEQKVISMSQDNNKIHKEYITCKSELSNLQGKYEILNESFEKLKSCTDKTMPVSVHNAAIEECKSLFEELKFQYETEKKKLNIRIKQLEETNPDIEKQFAVVEAERNQLKMSIKMLDKNLKRTQQKLEYFQNNMYSIQISRDSYKRQLNKTIAYCKQLVSEYDKTFAEREKLAAQLQSRENETADIEYFGNNITQRMNNLKTQLKNVQEDAKRQLAKTEKHIKIQERSAYQMKVDYRRELQRLKQLIRQKEDMIGKLQRDKNATQTNLELVWKAAANEDKRVKDVLKTAKIHNF